MDVVCIDHTHLIANSSLLSYHDDSVIYIYIHIFFLVVGHM
jgi:hypothetical protein